MLQFSQLRANRDFVLAAVEQNGEALWWADDWLKYTREFVLVAVERNGLALEFSPFKDNREIALAASKADYRAFEFADYSFRTDIDFWRAVVPQNGDLLKDAPSKIERNGQLRFTAAETSTYYALVVLNNMKTDLLTLEANRLSKTVNWLLKAVRTTAFGRRLFGEVDSELEYYNTNALIASELAAFWEKSEGEKFGLSPDKIDELNRIQEAAEEIVKITERPGGPLFNKIYKQEYENDFDYVDGARGHVVDGEDPRGLGDTGVAASAAAAAHWVCA